MSTPIEPGDRARAQALGKRSGQARRRLTPEDVEAALGALETPADVERWVRQLVFWATAGRIPGTTAQACASLLREWKDAHKAEGYERRLRELEDELAAARAGGPRRVAP